MAKKSYEAQLFLLLALVSLNGYLAQPFDYQITNSRPDPAQANRIELSCRETLLSNQVQNARFFLNNTRLTDIAPGNPVSDCMGLDITNQNQNAGELSFIITRECEGEYSCGDELPNSGSERIVALPPANTVILPITVYFKIGEDAILPPLIEPGALVQNYFIDWENAQTSVTLARLIGPRTIQPPPADPKYEINPDTFELTIHDLVFEDRGEYLGVVSVQDSGSSRQYMETRNNRITLEVLVGPQFIEAPSDEVVREGTSSEFRCVVEGYPRPEIHWEHNGMILNDDDSDYDISSLPSTSESSELLVTIGTLTIIRSTDDDIGTFTCVATTVFLGNRGTAVESRDAHLSVLGEVFVQTFITVQQELFFRIKLADEMEADLNLYIMFTSEDGRNELRNSSEAYKRIKEIVHFEAQSPFIESSQFSVQVSLRYGETIGPPSRREMIDSSKPTELNQILIQFVTPSVATILGAIIISTTAISIACCYRGYRCCAKVSPEADKHTSKILKDRVGCDIHEIVEIVKEYKSWKETGHKLPEQSAAGPPPPDGEERSHFFSCVRRCWESKKQREARESFDNVKRLLGGINHREPQTAGTGRQDHECEMVEDKKEWSEQSSYNNAVENFPLDQMT